MKKILSVLISFIALFTGCTEDDEIIHYKLTGLEIKEDKFYIRGVLKADHLDTFTQRFIIVQKSTNGFYARPPEATYRARLFRKHRFTNNVITYTDTFFVVLQKRHGDYFDRGKQYRFIFKEHDNKRIIDFFRRENCLGSYYFYYLTI